MALRRFGGEHQHRGALYKLRVTTGWLTYDHRVMHKKCTTPCPPMGCGAVERRLKWLSQQKTTGSQQKPSLVVLKECFAKQPSFLF